MFTPKRMALLLILLAFIGVGVGGWYYYRSHKRARSHLVTVIPIDHNNDGQAELLKVYLARGKDPRSVLQLEDQRGRLLWESQTPAISSYYETDSYHGPPLLRFGQLVVLSSKQYLGQRGYQLLFTAHRISDGKQIWSETVLRARPLAFGLLRHPDYLVYWTRTELTQPIELVVRDPKTGAEGFRFSTGKSYFYRPLVLGKILLLHNYSSTLWIDLENKRHKLLKGATHAVRIGRQVFLRQRGKTARMARLDVNSGTLTRLPDSESVRTLAKGLNRTVFGNELVVLPRWDGKSTPKTIRFYRWPDWKQSRALELGSVQIGISEPYIRRNDPQFSALGRLRTRFVPFFIRASTGINYTHDYRLLVLDLKLGRVAWKSRPVRRVISWTEDDVLYGHGRYLIKLHYKISDGYYRRALLILDGRSGRFSGAVEIEIPRDPDAPRGPANQRHNYPFKPAPHHLGKSWLAGSSLGNHYWLIDLNSLRLIHKHPDGVKLHDVRLDVEQKLGKLP